MLSFLTRQPANPADLLTSKLYDEKRFYSAFKSDLNQAQHQVIVESPYLTCKRANELLPVIAKLTSKGVKVRVNTRNPNHHDEYLRIQAWMAIKKYRAAGVKVKFYDDLRHRKLAVVDGLILWEGSLNILSQNNSREVMRRTQSEELCRQMIQFTGLNKWCW
jgi:phosphatidylserine/phosphatidylglycerophosphate/cardiolipin synthase-like enzyme